MNVSPTNETPIEIVGMIPTLQRHAPVEAVDRAIDRYRQWHDSLLAQTSALNHRLYLLQLVEEEAQDKSIKELEDVIEIILRNDARSVGDTFSRLGQTYTVLWRKIGPKYGVEMCLRSQDGQLLNGEFYD